MILTRVDKGFVIHLRRYGWAAASVLTVLAIVLFVDASRGPDLRGRSFRIGHEESPPVQYVTADGGPSGTVIDILREAARRGGIQLIWVHSHVGAEKSFNTREMDLWPIFSDLPWRRARFFVSRPYTFVRYWLVVNQERPLTSAREAS